MSAPFTHDATKAQGVPVVGEHLHFPGGLPWQGLYTVGHVVTSDEDTAMGALLRDDGYLAQLLLTRPKGGVIFKCYVRSNLRSPGFTEVTRPQRIG